MVRRTGWAFELKHHLCFNPLPWRLSSSPLPAPIDNGMSVIWKWEILASSHFEISYSSILAETAEKIAQYFEQIRKKNKNKKNGIRRF
jgi:hypothetical protein